MDKKIGNNDAARNVVIEPQSGAGSSVSVKAPSGSYAEFLSTEERQALDLLFARFQDSQRFGPAYRAETQNGTESKSVGRTIDLKV